FPAAYRSCTSSHRNIQMSSRVLRFSPILAHPKLDTLRDIPLAIYWDICLNDDIVLFINCPSRKAILEYTHHECRSYRSPAPPACPMG
ncbi:MAG: hypothetical protein ACK5UY_08185, partial [Holosporales bacterium]